MLTLQRDLRAWDVEHSFTERDGHAQALEGYGGWLAFPPSHDLASLLSDHSNEIAGSSLGGVSTAGSQGAPLEKAAVAEPVELPASVDVSALDALVDLIAERVAAKLQAYDQLTLPSEPAGESSMSRPDITYLEDELGFDIHTALDALLNGQASNAGGEASVPVDVTGPPAAGVSAYGEPTPAEIAGFAPEATPIDAAKEKPDFFASGVFDGSFIYAEEILRPEAAPERLPDEVFELMDSGKGLVTEEQLREIVATGADSIYMPEAGATANDEFLGWYLSSTYDSII